MQIGVSKEADKERIQRKTQLERQRDEVADRENTCDTEARTDGSERECQTYTKTQVYNA